MKLLLNILALIFIFGCYEGDKNNSSEGYPGLDTSQLHKEEIEKWNLYVDLGNYLASDFNPAMDEYFTKFDPASAFRPDEEEKYMADFLSKLIDERNLSLEIELALAKAAQLEGDLDQATYEVGVQLKEVWSELIKARDYYVSGQYASDELIEAREVHARIYDAYMDLSATNTKFWDILTKQDAERRKKDIQEFQEQGLILRSAMLDVIDKGQALQDLLNQLSITFGSLSAFDPQRFMPLYDDFKKSLNNFAESLAKAQNKNNFEGIKGKSLSDFTLQLKEAEASADDLIELRRLKAKLDESPENISGTPEHFGRELGLLVDIYNALAPAK